MEELKVTFTDKVSIVTKPVPLINKVTDADMNELKNKHNDTVDVLTTVDGRLTTAEGDITAVDGRLTTAEGDITALDTSKQNNLGITDETTHLLTPKEIREGEGAETKLITSQEADGKINQLPIVDTDFFENAEVSEDVFQLRPKFAPVSLSSQLPATGEQIAIFVAENTSISEIVASSGVVQFDNILRNYQNQNYSSLEVEGVVPVRRLILQRFGKLEFQDSTTINHSGFGWIIDGIGYEQDLDLEGQTVTGTPSTNPRIDILTGDNEGGITYTVGTELVTPVPPAIPTGQRLIASVLRATNGDNTITYAFEIDEKLEATTPSEAIAFDKLNIIEIYPTLFGKYAYSNKTVDIPEDDSMVDMLGAITWLTFREIITGNKIQDFSSNGVDADVVNPDDPVIHTDDLGDPVIELAVTTSGGRSYAVIPNNTALANLSTEWTVLLGFKTSVASSRDIFSTYHSSVGTGIRFSTQNGDPQRFNLDVNGGTQATTASTVFTLNEWHFIGLRMRNHESDSGLSRVQIFRLESGEFVNKTTNSSGQGASITRTAVGNTLGAFIGTRTVIDSVQAAQTRDNTKWAYVKIFPSSLTPEEMLQKHLDTRELPS
jgi:hypothetical protein